MSIVQDVADKQVQVARNTRCKVAREINGMFQEDMDAALAAIELCKSNPKDYSASWFARMLTNNGYSVGKTAVNDHLSGRCTCVRSQ